MFGKLAMHEYDLLNAWEKTKRANLLLSQYAFDFYDLAKVVEPAETSYETRPDDKISFEERGIDELGDTVHLLGREFGNRQVWN